MRHRRILDMHGKTSGCEADICFSWTIVAMHIEEAPVTRPLIFLGPLTKVQPANAGSRARKCEDLSLAFGLTAGGYTGNGTGRY